MTFAEKLTTLMDIFRLPNISIARGLDIDPSLVSRWKSGQREPADWEETVGALAVYLAGAPLHSHDRALLSKTLDTDDLGTREKLIRALARWLSGVDAGKSAQLEDGRLWEGLAALLSTPGALTSPGPVNLWPRVQKGQPGTHETFSGQAGRRQATINFLHTVLSGGKTHNVSLLLDGNTDWITEDPRFLSLWEQSLKTAVFRGCQVTMIHPAPQDTSALLSLLGAHWPLYQSGRFVSRLLPAALEKPALPTLFSVSGVAAMISYVSDDPGAQAGTLLFQNALDARLYDDLFRSVLRQTTPLASAGDDPPPWSPSDWESVPYVTLGPQPGPLWLPEEVAARYLPRDFLTGPPSLRQRQAAFLRFLAQGGQWLALWPETWLNDIKASSCKNGGLVFSADEWNGPEFRITGEDVRLTLLYMSALLRQYNGLTAAFGPPSGGLRAIRRGKGDLLFLPAGGGRAFRLEDPEALRRLDARFDQAARNGSDAVITRIARALIQWTEQS